MGLYVANYALLVVTFGVFVMMEFYHNNKQYSKIVLDNLYLRPH